MNKLLLLALFSSCLIVITKGSEQVEEKSIAEGNVDIAPLREVREADPKKDGEKKKGRKGNKNKKMKKNKKGKKLGKKAKGRKAGKNAAKKEKKNKKSAKKGKKNKKAKKGKKAKKANKNKKNKKAKKGRKSKKAKKGKKSRKNKKSKKGKKSKKTKKAKKGRKSKKNKKAKKGKKSKKNKKAKKGKKSKKAKKGKKSKKAKKGKKKTSRPGNRQSSSSSCMNATCIDNAMQYMKVMKDKVANFFKQQTRIGKYNDTSNNKAGKKGIFGPILNRIREAGGGNSSNLKCNGNNSSPGAKQLKNLTESLFACEENINKSCNADLPPINSTELKLCDFAMNAFSNMTKECIGKKSEEACKCWTNSSLTFTFNAVKKCDISEDNKKMTAAKKKCTNAFGKCRKLEDDVSIALSACSPANTESRAKADIKQGLKNKAEAQKMADKCNETAKATSRQAGSVTCAVFMTMVKDANGEILRAPLLKGLETKLKKVNALTVQVCSAAEKTSLIALSVEVTLVAKALDLNIEQKQTDLLVSTGSTVSVPALNETIYATTAPATVMTTKPARIVQRQLFRQANFKHL